MSTKPCRRRVAETAWVLDWPELPLEQSLLLSTHLTRKVSRLREQGEPPWSQLEDLVPGAGNLLLVWPLAALYQIGTLERALLSLADEVLLPSEIDSTPSRLHRIPVRYGGPCGPDLRSLAAQLGLTPAQVVGLHTSSCYVVAFLGFSPGFPYLFGLPEPLRIPRRKNPRPRVPAGSVAIAGPFTGIYPQATPGGWHLLGQTNFPCFDLRAAIPSPFEVGDRVEFQVEDFQP